MPKAAYSAPMADLAPEGWIVRVTLGVAVGSMKKVYYYVGEDTAEKAVAIVMTSITIEVGDAVEAVSRLTDRLLAAITPRLGLGEVRPII